MKDSQLLYTWGIIFFATCLLSSGGSVFISWFAGVVCYFGGLITRVQEKEVEECRQELMSKHS